MSQKKRAFLRKQSRLRQNPGCQAARRDENAAHQRKRRRAFPVASVDSFQALPDEILIEIFDFLPLVETAHSANPFGRRRLCRVCKKWNRLLNSARLTTWTEIGISIRETSSAQEISRGLENLRNILPNISQLVRDHLVVQACASRSQLMLFSDVEWDEEEPRADVFLIQLLRAIPAAHRPFCDLTLEQRQSFPQHVAMDDQANVRDLLRSVPIRNATLSDDIVWLFLCCVNAAALPNFLMHISPSSLGRPGGSSLQNGEIGELYWFLRTMNICVGVRDEFWLPLEGLMEHLWCIPVFGGCTDPMSAARNPHHQGWHEA